MLRTTTGRSLRSDARRSAADGFQSAGHGWRTNVLRDSSMPASSRSATSDSHCRSQRRRHHKNVEVLFFDGCRNVEVAAERARKAAVATSASDCQGAHSPQERMSSRCCAGRRANSPPDSQRWPATASLRRESGCRVERTGWVGTTSSCRRRNAAGGGRRADPCQERRGDASRTDRTGRRQPDERFNPSAPSLRQIAATRPSARHEEYP